jgi:5-methylcytosine-specific restriction endonuclease McrA
MGMRQRKWAKKKRRWLRLQMGGHCAHCQEQRNLTFDCIEGLGDCHGKKEYSWRTSIYWREWRKGNLQLLCKSCHDVKSGLENKKLAQIEQPF